MRQMHVRRESLRGGYAARGYAAYKRGPVSRVYTRVLSTK